MQPEARLAELSKLVRERQRSLGSFAWSCLVVRGHRLRKEDIEDVLSDAYVTAAAKLRREPDLEIEHFEAWFRRIVFFTALQHARKWRIPRWKEALNDIAFESDVLEQLHDRSSSVSVDERLHLEQLLARLSDEDQSILRLASEGNTSAEIAHHLASTPEAVRQRKSRALRQLRQAHQESEP